MWWYVHWMKDGFLYALAFLLFCTSVSALLALLVLLWAWLS